MIKLLIILIIILNINAETLKSIKFKDVVIDEVTSIYDGDTFRVNISKYPKIVGYRMSVRINGIDTPEKRGKCQKEKDLAILAKQELVKSLRSAKVIELRNLKRGKYFRFVADVFADGQSVSKKMIKKGLAVPYFGKKKTKNWCR